MASDIALPSWSENAEQSLLGAMMANSRACIDTIKEIQPDDFFRPAHGMLFNAIKAVAVAGDVDPVTLQNQLIADEALEDVGGMDYVIQVCEIMPMASNAAFYAKIVKEKKFQRDMSNLASQLRTASFDAGFENNEDRFSLWEKLTKEIRESYSRVNMVSPSLKNIMGKVNDSLLIAFHNSGEQANSTGYRSLDNAIGGWFPGDQVIVGAFTGDGKTAFMSDCVERCANRGGVCLIGSGEMKDTALAQRMVQSMTGVSVSDMRRGNFDGSQMSKMDSAMAHFSKLPVYVEDRLLKPDQLYAKAMRIKREHGRLDLITQDYAQLLTKFCKRGGVDEMDAMMMEYKEMAKDLDCTSFILSQFNTESQKEDRVPTLKDLKGTGGIVASADWVLLLHRPNKVRFGRERANCYIAKARFGAPQCVPLEFIPEKATWIEPGELR